MEFNKIYNMDCLEYMKTIPSNSIQFIMADPPYLISDKKDTFHLGDGNLSKYKLVQGDWDLVDNEIIYECIPEFKRILKRGGSLIIWYDWMKINNVATALDEQVLKQIRLNQWVKCLNGSTNLYVKNHRGEHNTMSLKDIERSGDWKKIQLWDGSNWNNIVNIEENIEDDYIYEIKLLSGEIIKSTPNHKYILNDDGIKLSSELEIDDILKTCNLPEGEKYHSHISDEMQWFIGLYLAEGSMCKKKMQIASHKKETKRIEKIKLLCEQYGGSYFVYEKPDSNSMSIVVSSKVIHSIVFEYIVGINAYTKHFTKKFWNMNNYFISNVFNSYLDGDAHYEEKTKRHSLGFTGKNNELEKDIRTICGRLNYDVTLNKANVKNTTTNKLHSAWRGKMYMNKKSERWTSSKIIDIKYVKKNRARYWDIELENEPHLFALGSGVLTHNSNPPPISSSNSYLPNAKEYFLYCAKNTSYKKEWIKAPFNSSYDKGVYEHSIAGKSRIHPTEKPYKLMEEIILKHTNEGDEVFIPFGGSGVDIEVCIKNNLMYVATEIDETYYKGIENRIATIVAKSDENDTK